MSYTFEQMKNLFMQQSYRDLWEDYQRSLDNSNAIKWDYIILTASNEEQAVSYRNQISYRLENHQLSPKSNYAVLPDPDGKRIGSGGATFHVLRYIAEQAGEKKEENIFKNKRILVIHSGGDSKRVPQYSAVGKLFSPVPRVLPDGRKSTLFDELIIGMSGVAPRFKEGMLVLSGDVLLLFNPLQIDGLFHGAAAVSIKENVEIGKNHGVFLNDGHDNVGRFLHKQSEANLRKVGAVNDHDCVDLDTGAVIFDCELLQSLFSLISTDGKVDAEKYNRFVSEKARISFYGDFLYPLAKDSTLEQYYKETAEGTINDALLACRKEIWDAVSGYNMKLICLSPADFIHFGTTKELLKLVTEEVENYSFLSWSKNVMTAGGKNNCDFASYNAYIEDTAVLGKGCYIENCYIGNQCMVQSGAIVSGLRLNHAEVPADTVWHGLRLKDGSVLIRAYGVMDDPKGRMQTQVRFLGTTLPKLIADNNLQYSDLWSDSEDYLWFANLYPVCKCEEEAVEFTRILCKMAAGKATDDEIVRWKNCKRESMFSSFNKADTQAGRFFERELESKILASEFVYQLSKMKYYKDALNIFGMKGISDQVFENIMEMAQNAPEQVKIRIYYVLSKYMKEDRKIIKERTYDVLETQCFNEIQNMIYLDTVKYVPNNTDFHIEKAEVHVELPVRVNWGGGWTDTPPYCNEKGGVVLNAALKVRGIYPIQVCVKRINSLYVEFESQDIGVRGTADSVAEIQDCNNPYDSFALHKAALIACGIIPRSGQADLQDILNKIGGGIYLSTQVVGIPKGSGLGTSSILSAACVKAIFQFLGIEMDYNKISEIVLGMEQIMSTGGGWQDQIGGLTRGVKLIRSRPGIHQHIEIDQVRMSEKAKEELQQRFALIYTGQRRLARNLLRDVAGNYMIARPESIEALEKIASLAVLMKFELERDNIDGFAKLLNQHWELSKQLDAGSTNTCIDYIFMSCKDLISGQFIAGAGGGGFLQVLLKKGITKEELRTRLYEVFQDSGVEVWDCEILY